MKCYNTSTQVTHTYEKMEQKIMNVYYIPTYAQISIVNLHQITPTCFGFHTLSSGSLQLC